MRKGKKLPPARNEAIKEYIKDKYILVPRGAYFKKDGKTVGIDELIDEVVEIARDKDLKKK